MLRYLIWSVLLFVASWVTFEVIGWAHNPYRAIGFPPPGHADIRHTQQQLDAIGLKNGMNRLQAKERLHSLGFRNCFAPKDNHFVLCRWNYRELLNPFEIAWIVKIEFTADTVQEITSLTGYGYLDH